jgi:ElaB/YqjD/DUF883 family membrane-anchored ribosome-binding protein
MDKEDLQENIDAAREKAQEKFALLKRKALEQRENAKKYIRDNPERAVLMTAGLGFVVGLIAGCAINKQRSQDRWN